MTFIQIVEIKKEKYVPLSNALDLLEAVRKEALGDLRKTNEKAVDDAWERNR